MNKAKRVKFKRKPKREYFLFLIKNFFFIIRVAVSLLNFYIVNFIYGKKTASVGSKTKLHPTVVLRQPERIFIGSNCLINHNNVFQAGKEVGKIVIGDHVQTGPGVMIFAFNHCTERNGTPMIEQDYIDADVIIEDDVWIGAGSIINAGVTIGKGAVIGSGSVVTKNIEQYSFAVGSPAKVIKKR